MVVGDGATDGSGRPPHRHHVRGIPPRKVDIDDVQIVNQNQTSIRTTAG
jgi:hypothetical protein